MKKLLLHLALFFAFTSYAQNSDYSIAKIAPELKENADAVVRLRQRDVVVSSRKSMGIITKDVVTVFNESGLSHMGASEYFNKSTKIKSIEATIFNAFGKEVKKIKRKDFNEISVSEGSIITDNKLLYLNYTPTEYPFTIVFQSEMESSNTAFIPGWYPMPMAFEGVEKSIITIKSSPELGLKYKAFNLEGNASIVKEEQPNGVSFTATSIPAFKNEEYSPASRNFSPHVLFSLTSFNLEGVEGTASDWKEFGAWMYSSLLKNTDEIPVETQNKIKTLVGSEKDPVKIAKIVYNYVQSKTRYISIQLGIGGWKPMLAKDVDRLGYGDCKALTNYTRALLNVVGVPSYYTIIYGDRQRRDLHQDFVSMQGNHAILALPVKDQIYWLECTSQVHPFGFQGDFTDNRFALLVKPEGGEIVKTHEYKAEESTQISKGKYAITETGKIVGSVSIKSKGAQYEHKFDNEGKSKEDLDKIYKNYFSQINNLKLSNIKFSNNREDVEFSEELSIEASEYAKSSGQRLIFAVNAYNLLSGVPQRYRVRNNPFEISQGFYDYDEITIDLPKGYQIEAKPENFEQKDRFGFYKSEYTLINETQLLYKRIYQTNSGSFDKKEYDDFRKSRETIAKNDNAKIVLIKI